jgi:hypothetical protein
MTSTPPSTRPRRTRAAALVLGASLIAAACGGDGETAEQATTTTPAETTTTTTEATAPEPDPDGPVAPLTGLVVDDPSILERPALYIKVDNHPRGRPQSGLDQADLVFEMRAEGVSRFAAVFHTNAPDRVGPVRSSRTADFDLLRGLNTPLYASSGGNDFVAAAIRQLPVINVTAITRTEYFRDADRSAPHNLYVDLPDLFVLAPDDATAPFAWFSYRDEGEALPASAQPQTGPVTVEWPGRSPIVTFTWDPELEGWARTQDGRPHTQEDGTQLAPANVVILVTRYGASPADAASPDLVSTGEGEAIVLVDGHLLTGRWFRPSPEDPPGLFTDDGQEIRLTPGQTWVLWPEAGNVSYGSSPSPG